MDNAALDRWLAENVMGWHTIGGADGYWRSAIHQDAQIAADEPQSPDDGICKICSWWHPTTNIAQAIETAEKARADGRIKQWRIFSPEDDCSDDDDKLRASALVFVPRRGWGDLEFGSPAEALCYALYAALT